MVEGPLEDLYFNWLYTKVWQVHNNTPSTSYDDLFQILYHTEFVWLLSGDDNRAEDGKDLRGEFLIAGHIPDDVTWRKLIPCSVFEMLIAFSRRAEFMAGGVAKDWFWEFIENLDLREVTDAAHVDPLEIQDTLEIFMFRTYRQNGDGGLFPLRDPPSDQTKLEIWYQFCDYLVDQDRLQ